MNNIFLAENVEILIEAIIAIILIWRTIVVSHKNKNHKHGKSKKRIIIRVIEIIAIYILIAFLTLSFKNPIIEESSKNTIKIEAKSGTELQEPKTIYMGKDVSKSIKVNGNIDYYKVGNYEVELEIPMLWGRKYTHKQTVQIVDTISPEITLKGSDEIEYSYAKEYKDPGYKAIDNYDGDITDKVELKQNKINDDEIEIVYTVSDTSGNTTEKKRKVHLIDDVAPVITLNGNQRMYVVVGGKYNEKGAKATDDKDGDLTSKITTEGSVNTDKAGTYTITYKVSDSKGNEGKASRTVIVYKQQEANSQNKDGVIYLTFDDGPSSSITPKVLDILKKKSVKATFFILNYDSNGEKYIKREVAEGHTVGIHGYSHNYKDIYKSVDAYMSNITKLQTKIKNSTGITTYYTRFPGGSSNTISKFNPGIMSKLVNEVTARGFKYFDWNVSAGDAGEAKNSADVYNNVTKGLRKTRANVVLMHDFSGNKKTLNALESIIDYGLSNGFTFSKIDDSAPTAHHGVNN